MGSNKGFQKHTIGKMLKKKGIHDFDLEAEIDETLNMRENIDKIEDELDLELRKDDPNSRDVRHRRRGSDKRQARNRHEMRSEQSQIVDESIRAERVLEPPLSDREFDRWINNPNELDIEGVDD